MTPVLLAPVLRATVAPTGAALDRLHNPFGINGVRTIFGGLRKGENKFSVSPRRDRIKSTIFSFQQLTAIAFSAMLAFSLTLGHAQAQDGPEGDERTAATAPESLRKRRGKRRGKRGA